MAWTMICRVDELTEGRGILVRLGARELAVFLHGGQPRVIDNRCPHAGFSLSGGVVDGDCAICPRHDWAFNLATGWLRGSTAVKVGAYPARIDQSEEGTRVVVAELPE